MLILLQARAEGKEEEDEPRDADFEEHLKVQDAEETGVELRTEEEVDNEVVSHTDGCAADASRDICDGRAEEARDDGNAHDVAKLVNQGVKLEVAAKV